MGYLLGAVTAPLWEHIGEVIKEGVFPPVEPDLSFIVEMGAAEEGLELKVKNAGDLPASIGALHITFCKNDAGLRVIDTYVDLHHRPRIAWDKADEQLKQRLQLNGDNEWAVACDSDQPRAQLTPVQDTPQLSNGTHSVKFRPYNGLVISSESSKPAGYTCILDLSYGPDIDVWERNVWMVTVCNKLR